MEKGDIVRHTFSRCLYIIERLTPKKAEVRSVLASGLSDSTLMILQRSLKPLTVQSEILDLAQAAFERRDWELKDRIMTYYYKLWPRVPPQQKDDMHKGWGHASGMYHGIRH